MTIHAIGPHRVRHGDINVNEGLEELIAGRKASIFYSDPPWGSGNLKYWDTMNRKMNEDNYVPVETTDVVQFLHRVLSLAADHTDGWVVIEYGKRWSDQVIEVAKTYGLHHCSTVEALYGSTNLPLDVIVFHTDSPRNVDLSTVHHLKGYACVKEVFRLLKPEQNGVGMDLCCGLGYTARACLDNGLTFIGNELNATRMAETIKKLERGTKQ